MQVYYGIEDVCGKRMLLQLLPHIASRRACASNIIDIKSFKAHCHVGGSEAAKKMFWEVFEEFENEAKEKSRSPVSHAVNWVLEQKGITSVVLGVKSTDQLADLL